jgi:hypothetical protein
MNFDELKTLLILSSIPIRNLRDESVRGSASGCIIHYHQNIVLLTVAHGVGSGGDWAIEMEWLPNENRTKLQRVGPMNYLRSFNIRDGTMRDIDFAYAVLKEPLAPKHQQIEINGTVKYSCDTITLESDLTARPAVDQEYGFFGHTKVKNIGNLLAIEPRLEMGMKFIEEDDDGYVFQINRASIAYEEYAGCSGAPVIDTEGNVVALAMAVSTDRRTLHGLKLRQYRAAIDIECGRYSG